MNELSIAHASSSAVPASSLPALPPTVVLFLARVHRYPPCSHELLWLRELGLLFELSIWNLSRCESGPPNPRRTRTLISALSLSSLTLSPPMADELSEDCRSLHHQKSRDSKATLICYDRYLRTKAESCLFDDRRRRATYIVHGRVYSCKIVRRTWQVSWRTPWSHRASMLTLAFPPPFAQHAEQTYRVDFEILDRDMWGFAEARSCVRLLPAQRLR